MSADYVPEGSTGAATDDLVSTRDTARIAEMFNHISSRYDLMNRIMTFGQDGRWRKLAVSAARLKAGDRALDVATGTGDMARELSRKVGPTGSVVGVDVAGDMLQRAQSKTAALPVTYVQRDVHQLAFDSEFSAAIVSFGLRNFQDRQGAVLSMVRALKDGGRLVVLELIPAHGRLKPFVEIYERRLIPLLGRILAQKPDAYQYLPQSVAASISPAEIKAIMVTAGLTEVACRELNMGTVAIVSGTK